MLIPDRRSEDAIAVSWRTALYALMGVIWLGIGIGRLHRGEVDFTSIASVFTGLCWFAAAFVWRPSYLR
ncbi:MAG: hypothetical protein ACRYHC_09640 [Janthinobacterium lividum]